MTPSEPALWMSVVAVLFVFALLARLQANDVWPLPSWRRAAPVEVGMDLALLEEAKAYALTGDGSGCIVGDEDGPGGPTAAT